MVKPPKTMQPEAHDLSKAGRGGGKAFQQDSFHQYLARKIDLQRQQFGLVLPPPPTAPPQRESPFSSPLQKNKRKSSLLKSPTPTKKNSSPRSSTKKSKSPRVVRFVQLPSPNKQSIDMGSILQRLQKRHGKGNKRLVSKKRKRRDATNQHSTLLLECIQEEASKSSSTTRKNHREEDIDDDDNDAKMTFPSQLQSQSVATPTTPSPSFKRLRPDLFFLGVVVKVNGYTHPDNETLKRLLQRHGGDLETYETERVTHIVAEHLSTAKAEMYKRQRKPKPVCTPSWIVDSAQVGKLLPYGPYLLQELRDRTGQVGIQALFGTNNASTRKQQQSSTTEEKRKIGKLNTKSAPLHWAEELPVITESEDLTVLLLPPNSARFDLIPDALTQEPTKIEKPKEMSSQPSEETYLCLRASQPTLPMLPQPSDVLVETKDISAFECDEDVVDLCQDEAVAKSVPEAPTPTKESHQDESSSLKETGKSEDEETRMPLHAENTVGRRIEGHREPAHDKPFEKANDTRTKSPEKSTRKSLGRTDAKFIHGKIRTTGTDPNFLNSFFSNSRLSFIGSYKQRATTPTSPPKHNISITQSKNTKRFVFHVDMDCFFAAVALRNFPQYKDKPVAISHHGKHKNNGEPLPSSPEIPVSKTSTSECATCNYKAREYGIKKGMFLGRAKRLCPELVVLCYDFEGYEEVSEQVLEILQRVSTENTGSVEAVSCDEAYVELFLADEGQSHEQAGVLAETVRKEIFQTTQCTASIGVACNKFLAKLATDRCKPDGSFVVTDHRALLEKLRLRDLHGIGYRSEPKLAADGMLTVQDVWDLGAKAEGVLSRILGPGLGMKICMYCQGQDDRPVKAAERKTIGAECNYGVRFDGKYGIDHFIRELANEVHTRMEGVGVKGKRVTVKVKQRKKGAKPPPKFLGHGSCHNLSKSIEIPGCMSTSDAKLLSDAGMILFNEMAVPLEDVRGMGLVISKLSCEQTSENDSLSANGIGSWLKSSNKTEAKASKKAIKPLFRVDKAADAKMSADVSTSREAIKGVVASLPLQFQQDRLSGNESGSADGSIMDDEANRDQGESVGLATGRNGIRKPAEVDPSADVSDNAQRIVQHDGHTQKTESSPSFTQIALPPLSQIRMSQVEALPTALQEQIKSKMQGGETVDGFRIQGGCIDVDDLSQAKMVQDGTPDARVREESTEKVENSSSRQQSDYSEHGNCRFRQTSLKRMMKLAAVKSGNATSNISLTQLDQLPLNIKLQVVNGDSGPLGALSPQKQEVKRARASKDRLSTSSSARKEASVVDLIDIPEEEPDGCNMETNSKKENSNALEVESHSVEAPLKNGLAKKVEPLPEGPDDFYDEDVLPLKLFLDENTALDAEAIDHVTQFLTIVLKEGRLRDLVSLIRSIRNRKDDWSARAILDTIVDSLDNEHMQKYGTRLDTAWLVGR